MTSEFSWQNSVSLYPASFCTPRQLLTSYFCIPVPYNGRDLFLVLVLEGLVVILELFSTSVWGIDLDYCNIEWFALQRN